MFERLMKGDKMLRLTQEPKLTALLRVSQCKGLLYRWRHQKFKNSASRAWSAHDCVTDIEKPYLQKKPLAFSFPTLPISQQKLRFWGFFLWAFLVFCFVCLFILPSSYLILKTNLESCELLCC